MLHFNQITGRGSAYTLNLSQEESTETEEHVLPC